MMLYYVMRASTDIRNPICPGCLETFETRIPDKVFCTPYCRNKVHRQRERAQQVPKAEPTAESQMYFMEPVVDPTVEQIVKIADLLVLTKSNKPQLFRGALP